MEYKLFILILFFLIEITDGMDNNSKHGHSRRPKNKEKASHSSPPQEGTSVRKNVPNLSSKPSNPPMPSIPSTKPSGSASQLVSLKDIDGRYKDSFNEGDASNIEEPSDKEKPHYYISF